MFTLSKMASYAAVGTLVILGGVGLSARADELVQHLGPVGPHEPIHDRRRQQGGDRLLRAGWHALRPLCGGVRPQ